MSEAHWAPARRLLCELQAHIRDIVIAARHRQARSFARVVGVTSADTIYFVDKRSAFVSRGWRRSAAAARTWATSWLPR